MENKGKTMMIVIIVLLAILIVTIFGVSIYAIKMIQATDDGSSTNTIAQAKNLDQSEIYSFSLTDPIAVNLAVGTDGQEHSASVELGIGIDKTTKESTSFITLMESQEVVIRDTIISVLRNKTVEDLRQRDAQEAIGEEILEKLRAEFNTDLIYDVYFGTFYYN